MSRFTKLKVNVFSFYSSSTDRNQFNFEIFVRRRSEWKRVVLHFNPFNSSVWLPIHIENVVSETDQKTLDKWTGFDQANAIAICRSTLSNQSEGETVQVTLIFKIDSIPNHMRFRREDEKQMQRKKMQLFESIHGYAFVSMFSIELIGFGRV